MHDLLELTARAESDHFWFQGFRAHVAPVIREIAAGRRDLRILDCGCGTGYNLTTLLRPYGRACGFDLTLHAMRSRADGCAVVRADIERIPFADGTFDLATSFDVLQSVPDDGLALREMARVLRSGGHAVINVTALRWLGGDHNKVWGERRRHTRRSAARLVSSAGLEPVRLSFLFGSLVPLMLAVRTAQRLLRAVREPRGDTDLAVPAAPVNAALAWLVRREAAIARRVAIPFGSSLLMVGRKP